ncbi:F-box protein At2g07140-like [Silene latifolia]|uniref:F-box protein At2g07140-like n=1 Tax=Silene latifolia TaxID=37657 RepID=UPI003D77A000
MMKVDEEHASKKAKVTRTGKQSKRKRMIGGYFNVLPCEILHEIALMLPFTSIKSLRCSCMFLYNILTDNKFVDMHWTRELQKPVGYLFTPFYKYCHGRREVYIVEQSGDEFITSKMFEYSTNIEVNKMSRFQSSGGLMCVYMTLSNCFRIFNPNIAEEVQVRNAPIFKKCRHWWFFCYSPSTKEYKILKLGVLLRNNSIESTVGAIYTLGSNIWRKIKQNIPHQYFDNFVECQGNLFWMKKRCLISFDLVSEEFHVSCGPQRKRTSFNADRVECVGLKAGRLINMGHTIGCIHDYILWVLEDRTKGIWIKRHEFLNLQSYRNRKLVGILENGNLFGFEELSANVFIQHIGCSHITDMKISKVMKRIAYVAPHVRSFVSPVRIMAMGKNKQVYDHCHVGDISHERKWVLDTLKLGDDATEDDLFHRMYEVLNLQPQLKG